MNDALAERRALRVRRVEVSPELIGEFLKVPADGLLVGARRIFAESDAVPLTARILRAGLTRDGSVSLLIEDASFSEVTEGDVVPQMTPVYRMEMA